ncbi:MAG: hypothetical protein GX219_01305 [Tissierellia bacterium]|nr:hypothetical protein [Tissierellia bacterium]
MRRIISLFLVAILILIPLRTIFAQSYDVELKKAILKMKDLFKIDENFDKFTSSVNQSEDEVDFYLNWQNSKNRDSINITVSKDGSVKNYYSSTSIDGEKKLSYDQGIKEATKYIKKISGFKDNEFRILENKEIQSGIYYDYIFQKLIDSIPIKSNGRITISSVDGSLVSFNQNFPKVSFPSTKNLISEKEALDIYKKELGLYRMTQEFYDYEESKTFFKTYFAELYSSLSIDASTKEIVTSDYPMYARDMVSNVKEAATDESLSPAEQKAVSTLEGIISQEKALEIAQRDFPILKDLKLENTSFYQSSRGMLGETGIWQFRLSNADGFYANVSVDALSEIVVSYYYAGKEFKGKEISYEEAKKISEELIKKLNPQKFESLELDKHNKLMNNGDIYSFNYRRIDGDTYIVDEGFDISISKKGGILSSYSLRWNDGRIEILNGGISKEKAYNIFFKDNPLELYGEVYYGGGGQKPQGRFVWGPAKRDLRISAANGKLLNYDGKEMLDPISYSDVAETKYEKSINGLKDLGYGYRLGKFQADKPMIQVDFLYLVMSNSVDFDESTVNRDKIIKAAIDRNIINKEDVKLDSEFRLLDYSKYIVKSNNLERIAERSEIFANPYKDSNIEKEDLAYINLAYGLGLIDKTENGSMLAYKQLTRGEFADLFYRYLTK